MSCLRSLIALAFLLLPISVTHNPSLASDTSPSQMTAEQLASEIGRLDGEIQSLQRSDQAPRLWKERMALEEELQAKQSRYFQLSNAPESREWESRIASLRKQINELRGEQAERSRAGGKEILKARHAELSKQAIQNTPQLQALGLSVLTFPQIDGSTSTQPLAHLIACKAFGADYAWLGRLAPVARLESAYPMYLDGIPPSYFWVQPEPEFHLLEFNLMAKPKAESNERLAAIINSLLSKAPSTHDAYVRLIEGGSDIALLARPPSASELELAAAKKVSLDAVPFALDALVFLVNGQNPTRNLTSAQIRSIYSSEVSYWEDWEKWKKTLMPGGANGNANGKINAYQREEKSGSEELMKTLVMKGTAFRMLSANDYQRKLIVPSMIGVYSRLSSDAQGLGYSVYYYERFMAGTSATRIVAVDGVEPNFDTIRDRKYPYTSPVLVVTRKDLDDQSPARKLRNWLLSPEGQAVVRESGYVPFTGRER